MGRGPVEPNLPPPQTHVQNADKNDPRVLLPLDTANLGRTPMYIRFEPEGSNDNWNLRWAVFDGPLHWFTLEQPNLLWDTRLL
jgi:hypothetical protein